MFGVKKDLYGWKNQQRRVQAKKAELTTQIDQNGKMIEVKNTKLKELELQGNEETKEAIGILEQVVRENKLTDGLAKALVKEIRVYDEFRVEIRWNFSEVVVKFILGIWECGLSADVDGPFFDWENMETGVL